MPRFFANINIPVTEMIRFNGVKFDSLMNDLKMNDSLTNNLKEQISQHFMIMNRNIKQRTDYEIHNSNSNQNDINQNDMNQNDSTQNNLKVNLLANDIKSISLSVFVSELMEIK